MILAKVKTEKGSAFILALMVVAAVGLLVTPVIYLATTGLRSTNLAQQRFLERYAADAGVEQGIWIIENDPNYLPAAGITLPYQSTFNNLPTDIEIMLLALPAPMDDPPTTAQVSGAGMSINKIVSPQYVPPCLSGITCPWLLFTYTIFIENYGESKLHLDRFGDCLPLGFKFGEVIGVEGIFDNASNDQLTLDDLDDVQLGPTTNDDDLPEDDFPCLDGRQQVKWDFESPNPYVLYPIRAKIIFTATAQIGPPAEHFNEAWVNANPNASTFDEPIIMEEPVPVIVEFEKYDISSTAGGTTVNARATVFKYPFPIPDESYILSWQVE